MTFPRVYHLYTAMVRILLLNLFLTSFLLGEVKITEFLAKNSGGLLDEDGDDSDWIEVTNTGASAVNMDGWSLTDDSSNLAKWKFPAVTLNAGQKIVVFASNKNRAIAGNELHTNFKLSGSGEYLAVVKPDEVTRSHEYSPSYPPQFPNISYGLADSTATSEDVIEAGHAISYKVPSDNSEDINTAATPWNNPAFTTDGSWTASTQGLGYSRGNNDPYDDFIAAGSDVETDMDGENGSVYLRYAFNLTDVASITSVRLKIRYDDGFSAYINGGLTSVASRNAPADNQLAWNSTATNSHPDNEALALEEIVLNMADFNLVNGQNILAIHGLNVNTSNSDALFDCELEITRQGSGVESQVYMTTPSPNEDNNPGVSDLGPIFMSATETVTPPVIPSASDIIVSAKIEEAGFPVSAVRIYHRIMYQSEASSVLSDDGVSPDLVAGDGIYTASIPLAGANKGEMIRWRFEAEDSAGVISKAPFYNDPLNSPEYFGTIVADETITSSLPLIHWFTANPGAAGSTGGTRASAFYNGEFYDNFFVRSRGASTGGLNKKSFKFDFNSNYHFRYDVNKGRVEELNLNTTYTDKAYIRQPLSYDVYSECGSPGSECFLVRLHQNGAFFSVTAFTEQVDKRLLKREGLDNDGSLYKMFNAVTSASSGVEKKNRRHENNSDLQALVSGVTNATGSTLENNLFDMIDVPKQLNYMVGTILTQNNDNMRKNFYLYRDSDGDGEWNQIPWDTDLTWGSHYMTNDRATDDGIWATEDYVLGGAANNSPIHPSHPFAGAQEYNANRSHSKFLDTLLSNPRFKEMFRRRLQTVSDEILNSIELDQYIDNLEALITPDAVEDTAKWGQFGASQTLAQAVDILQNDYLTPRRNHLLSTHLASNVASYPFPSNQAESALLPGTQTASFPMQFGANEANPSSGNQDEEFIEITNPNAFSVDISGWSLSGGVDYTFEEGAVIEAGGTLYVSPHIPSFRARTISPKGGEGNFVLGNYQGQISARGEAINLLDKDLNVITTLNTAANPTLAQDSLRITEILFAPTAGSDAEFIEFKNIGSSTLDLSGIYFSDGIEFTFPNGTSLAPGEIGIIVKDPALYPSANILGTFSGALNNSGERLTLRDAVGENILSFEYGGDWFRPARHQGYSIVIRDENTPWQEWGDVDKWALSLNHSGSPSTANGSTFSTSFEEWARANFNEIDLMDPNTSGPSADADNDGVSNFAEYAFGTDANGAAGGVLSYDTDGSTIDLSYVRATRAVDVNFILESGNNLEGWAPETRGAVAIDPAVGSSEKVNITGIPMSEVKEFFRLRITPVVPFL